MDVSAIPFCLSDGVRKLLEQVEQKADTVVILREREFSSFDDHACASGGFDEWTPVVSINKARREEFDEHSLAHELLHIKRFLQGVHSLETPEMVQGIDSNDARIRKAFANDLTNQIEHAAIFPQLVELGFDPHKQADEWKRSQIADIRLEEQHQHLPTSVQYAWSGAKVGISPFLGASAELQREYRTALSSVAPGVLNVGDNVTAVIKRYGFSNPYSLRRLYIGMLRAVGVPKRAFLLKQMNFRLQRESLELIP